MAFGNWFVYMLASQNQTRACINTPWLKAKGYSCLYLLLTDTPGNLPHSQDLPDRRESQAGQKNLVSPLPLQIRQYSVQCIFILQYIYFKEALKMLSLKIILQYFQLTKLRGKNWWTKPALLFEELVNTSKFVLQGKGQSVQDINNWTKIQTIYFPGFFNHCRGKAISMKFRGTSSFLWKSTNDMWHLFKRMRRWRVIPIRSKG